MNLKDNPQDASQPVLELRSSSPEAELEAKAAQLEALVRATGLPATFGVINEYDKDGIKTPKLAMALVLPPEETEKVVKALTIKPVSPDKEGGVELRLESVMDLPPPRKQWTAAERKKRGKPKNDPEPDRSA